MRTIEAETINDSGLITRDQVVTRSDGRQL